MLLTGFLVCKVTRNRADEMKLVPRSKLGATISFVGFVGMGLATLLAIWGLDLAVAVSVAFAMWIVVVIGMFIQRRLRD